ncbi:MAG TPA: DUF4974 domain-containing protein [Pedobacter sp.]|uniref:DUF4974 domain-containing protein n=1 Tax=Pedobacter sp. TaxID=1411316 RepID=UPI002BD98AC5|nr:DUF4974 domain-containing protein [Pedobacter sp.]HMI01699.1 DUF4974 domain-containing protein [Pedobacter sp.]
MVIEALTYMRYTGAERILVLEGKRQIGWVTFAELTNFIYDFEDAGNVRVHKLNFDLGTAMISIRDIRIRDNTGGSVLKPLLTFALIVLSVVLLYAKPIMRFVREVMKKLEPVEVVVPKKVVRKVEKVEELEFRQKPLEDIMNVLTDWYGVEVVYEDDSLRKMRFGGSIGKAERLEWVLEMLQATKMVRFRVEGKRVYVMRERQL